MLLAAQQVAPNVLDSAADTIAEIQTLAGAEVFAEKTLDCLLFQEHQTQELADSNNGNMCLVDRIWAVEQDTEKIFVLE